MTVYAVYGEFVEATRTPVVLTNERRTPATVITPGLTLTLEA